MSIQTVNQTEHNALPGHELVLQFIRWNIPDSKIGLVENLTSLWPLLTEQPHLKAAELWMED